MALTQVVAGDRILAADINQFYNILKGVAASGEAITLVYNAAAALIFHPSSNPAAGTEVMQVKNTAGTVQGSLTFDGKVKVADGTAALPSMRFQSEATGLYLSSAGVLGFSTLGASRGTISSTEASFTGFLTGAGSGGFTIGSKTGAIRIDTAGAAGYEFRPINAADGSTGMTMTKAKMTALPAFVASDKYVVVAADGELHVSALGPAS